MKREMTSGMKPRLRRVTAGVLALATAAPLILAASAAEARPDLRQMNCAQAQQMVRQNGKVVFTTGPHTYSLFVADRRYCDRNQALFVQHAQTKDAKNCPVAYECREPLFLRRDRF